MIHLFNAIICYAEKTPCTELHGLKQGKQEIKLPDGRKVTFYIELYEDMSSAEDITYIDNIRTSSGDAPAILVEKVK